MVILVCKHKMAARSLFSSSSDESSSDLDDFDSDADYKPLNWDSLTDTSDMESTDDEVIPPSPEAINQNRRKLRPFPPTGPTPSTVDAVVFDITGPALPHAVDAALPGAGPTDPASRSTVHASPSDITGPAPALTGTKHAALPGLTGPAPPGTLHAAPPGTNDAAPPGLTGPAPPGMNDAALPGLTSPAPSRKVDAAPPGLTGPAPSSTDDAVPPDTTGPALPSSTNGPVLPSTAGAAFPGLTGSVLPDGRTDNVITRKRSRNPPENWKCVKRQTLKEAGEEYVSVRNKLVPAKKIKDLKACEIKCKFQCKNKISQLEREALHQSFKTLDFTRKHAFILSTTECFDKATKKPSRRSKFYEYNFNVQGHKVRVCKNFYLGTLSVSQKMVYGSHQNKNDLTGTPKTDGRGKHAKKTISDADKRFVIDHINSFPRVESHYCRSTTIKEYLEDGLNLQKMYNLYVEKCMEARMSPVKVSYYRYIFNYHFNLEFHQRKTDGCDFCEKIKVARVQNLLTAEDEGEHVEHINNKNSMRKAAEQDKTDGNIDIMVSFDLQNVISLPRADISSFFYKRKLSVYNLTGHTIEPGCSNKEGYCVIWPENMSGRAGNDIASAFLRMLEKMTEGREDVKNITTWSDSCVPQNRNRIMSFAIFHFLQTHPSVESITMKFSVPGHSCVQHVDNMHSQIEKALASNKVFSPVSLMRVLKKVNSRKSFNIIQMRTQDFKDFKSPSDLFQFENVPFSRVSVMKFTKEPTVSFKLNHHSEFQTVSLRKLIKTRKASKQTTLSTHVNVPQPKVKSTFNVISKEKESDLKSMLQFMSAVDKAYYDSIFKSN